MDIGGGLVMEEGITGVFTRNQEPGAIPNGSAIYKTNSEDGDGTPEDTKGEVLGSLAASAELHAEAKTPPHLICDYVYFVTWENAPTVAVGVLGSKLRWLAEDGEETG